MRLPFLPWNECFSLHDATPLDGSITNLTSDSTPPAVKLNRTRMKVFSAFLPQRREFSQTIRMKTAEIVMVARKKGKDFW